MTISTLQKDYKKLENRLETLEQVIKEFFGAELKEEKIKKLEKISLQLDRSSGRRFSSYNQFKKYLKSL